MNEQDFKSMKRGLAQAKAGDTPIVITRDDVTDVKPPEALAETLLPTAPSP